jgi:hypothetical protein
MAQKYTITHIMHPAFVTLSEQKYLMPGWIPVSNDVTLSDVTHVNPYKTKVEEFKISGSSGHTYIITKRNGKVSCNCPAGTFRGTCKHIATFQQK